MVGRYKLRTGHGLRDYQTKCEGAVGCGKTKSSMLGGALQATHVRDSERRKHATAHAPTQFTMVVTTPVYSESNKSRGSCATSQHKERGVATSSTVLEYLRPSHARHTSYRLCLWCMRPDISSESSRARDGLSLKGGEGEGEMCGWMGVGVGVGCLSSAAKRQKFRSSDFFCSLSFFKSDGSEPSGHRDSRSDSKFPTQCWKNNETSCVSPPRLG